VFYHTLFDENAASHIAIGRAYKDCLEHAQTMNESELESAGVNTSLMHVDWMIGSGQVSVDGVKSDGSLEPVMRDGEWTLG
jgi:aminopeptidase